MGYYKKALNSLGWMSGLRITIRALTLVKTVVLARVLSPSQFGIYGIGILVLGFLETLTETGVNIFLIQKKGIIDKYVNSSWFVSIVRGLTISIFLILFAPFIAIFFNLPDTKNIVYLISLIPLIRGFINPACVNFQKEIKFKKQFFYESTIFTSDAVIAIILGIFTRSEYSLVIAMIFAASLEMIMSHIIFNPKPKFIFEKEKAMEIINRGKWITGAGIFNYLFTNMDNIFIGKLLGAGPLGIYQQAYRISTIPVTEVGEIFNKVTFPIYVKISENKRRLKKAFLKTLLIICLFVTPFGLLIFYFPIEIIKIIYGEQWITMAPILQILAIFGIVKAIFNSFFSLFLGLKKQEVVTLVTFVSSAFLIVSLYPLIKIFGSLGAAYAVLITTLFCLPLTIFYFFRLTKEK